MHLEIASDLRSHSVSFEVSRDALSKWLAQPLLEEDGWDARWEDLCAVEVERWGRELMRSISRRLLVNAYGFYDAE